MWDERLGSCLSGWMGAGSSIGAWLRLVQRSKNFDDRSSCLNRYDDIWVVGCSVLGWAFFVVDAQIFRTVGNDCNGSHEHRKADRKKP